MKLYKIQQYTHTAFSAFLGRFYIRRKRLDNATNTSLYNFDGRHFILLHRFQFTDKSRLFQIELDLILNIPWILRFPPILLLLKVIYV